MTISDDQMRALTFLAPGRLAWQAAPRPRLQSPTDAIVRPIAATTCDLDRLIVRGEAPFRGPFAIGHECIAEVAEVGEGVTRFRPGDIVVVHWHISCGHCGHCDDGRPNSCETFQPGAMYGLPGLGDWGGTFSDWLRVIAADTSLTPVPAGLDPVLVASAADNLPFAFEMTVPHLLARPGAPVLVMGGCGSIALYAVMFAMAAGAGSVTYCDTDPARLALAGHYGATLIEGPPPRQLGRFPLVVDASANAQSLLCGIRSVDPEGQVNSVGGHFADVALPLFEMYRRGVHFYTGRGRGGPGVAEPLEWVAKGLVDPRPVTNVVAEFDDAPAVLAEAPLKPVLSRPPIFSA